MLTDRELAQIQLAAYAYDGVPFRWNWYHGEPGLHFGQVKQGDTTVVCFLGTDDPTGWKLNFAAFPELTDHPQFGRVPTGFFAGIETALATMPAISGPTAWIGHSRGGAQAVYGAALRGISVDRLVCFAPPRPGTVVLAGYLAGIPKTLYRNGDANGHDYVTDVPFDIPGLAPYCHVGPLTDISQSPPPNDPWKMLRYHHMELYLAGMK